MEKTSLENLTLRLRKLLGKLLTDSKSANTGFIIPDNLCNFINDSNLKGYNIYPHDIFSIPGQGFCIGSTKISNPIISAPLAGISDNTHRIFSRFFGSALTFTEMITIFGIHYNHQKSLSMAGITGYERPCVLQLFGSDEGIMAETAGMLEGNADIIDINMGCPVPKILKGKSGGYLMQDERKIRKIISRVVSATGVPVSIKTRLGWSKDNINILRVAKIVEDSGASAITIHGRTVKQGFSGRADYGIIKEVCKSVRIPVIASGDIDSGQKAHEVMKYTGCKGIMVGRAAKGNLWLLTGLFFYLLNNDSDGSNTVKRKNRNIPDNRGCHDFDPDVEWKKDFARLYLDFLVYFKGEEVAIREFRKYLGWIFKGIRDIGKYRQKFFMISNIENASGLIDSIN